MKVVLLAGGLGTRISEESHLKPKPMIEIGEMPILWHIMKLYSFYGYNDFIICAGYKQHIIKEWFANYFLHTSDVTFDFSHGNHMVVHNQFSEPWKVTIIDTGLNTMTGGRVKRVAEYIGEKAFFLTYGDGVANVNIKELLEFHIKNGKLATITGVKPEGRFGIIELENKRVVSFKEKNEQSFGWINGGFMVLEPECLEMIEGDHIMLEREPMEKLSEMGELMCFKHEGFWQCMDTMRDKEKLDHLWESKNAPWKVWE